MIVTTSWDDGHPADLQLAELLIKYGIGGTFYVPNKNSEGRAVMGASEVREMSRRFEIAAHTLDHVDLTMVPNEEADRQIREGRYRLEDMLGTAVHGFCYPRGHYNQAIRKLTVNAGFTYARTIKNFCAGVGRDPFAIPVTLQFFPHSKIVYWKSLLKYGPAPERVQLCLAALAPASLGDRVRRLFDLCGGSASIFHLWGHSWEIEEHNLWKELEAVFGYLSRTLPQAAFATNLQAVARTTMADRALNGLARKKAD